MPLTEDCFPARRRLRIGELCSLMGQGQGSAPTPWGANVLCALGWGLMG
jgi:hypothetical protein